MKKVTMRDELVHIGKGAHALATQMLGNSADAADAVQDAMATVLGRPSAYDANKGPLKPWFLRIVRNRCLDVLRRRRPADDRVDEISDTRDGPEKVAEASQQSDRLKQALASLDGMHRQIIVLRDYLDLSYGEIADVLDIPSGTVMSRLHRARLALAKAFRNQNEQL